MKSWTITIPREPTSANKLLRMHWAPRNRLLDEWKHDVYYLCREAGVPKCARIIVDVRVYYRTRRARDRDNAEFGVRKLLGDSLEGTVVFNDNPSFLRWGAFAMLHDPDNPRIEVTITDDPR